jgi:hypothetical protein
MNELEDRLRDAYHAAAITVRPEAVRALHATSVRPLHEGRGLARLRAGRNGGRWMGLLIPLGAAAAVTALVLAALAIVPRSGGHAATAPGASGGQGHGGQAAAALPEFTMSANGSDLQVIRTATGQVAGQVAAPAGQSFGYVAGTADDRTFLVAADLNPQTSCETFLYQVRLSASGQPSAPARFAGPGMAGVLPTAVALSADGGTAAVSTVRCAGEAAGQIGGAQVIGGIYLIGMATGHVTRQWAYNLADDYTHDLSLSADGSKVAFSMILNDSLVTGVRVLAAGVPSGMVDSASRVVLNQPRARYAGIDAAQISPDGGTLYACTTAGSAWTQETTTLAAYSATTGQRTRVLRSWPPSAALSCALTMDPAGRYLLLALGDTPDGKLVRPVPGQPKRGDAVTTKLIAVSLTSGGFSPLPTQLPGPATEGGLAW